MLSFILEVWRPWPLKRNLFEIQILSTKEKTCNFVCGKKWLTETSISDLCCRWTSLESNKIFLRWERKILKNGINVYVGKGRREGLWGGSQILTPGSRRQREDKFNSSVYLSTLLFYSQNLPTASFNVCPSFNLYPSFYVRDNYECEWENVALYVAVLN